MANNLTNSSLDYYRQNNGRKFGKCVFSIDKNGIRTLKRSPFHYIRQYELGSTFLRKEIKNGMNSIKINKPIGKDYYNRQLTFLKESLFKFFRLNFTFSKQGNIHTPIITHFQNNFNKSSLKTGNNYIDSRLRTITKLK